MQQVQIYINDERVEMFDFESVTITDTIKDVRDVSKIFTEYSQTFSLPASKSNNKIFKHYYNSDIVNSFDSRVRVPAKIDLNSITFKYGYIQLEGVDLRNNKAQTYRVTFFGNTVSLKDLLGDDLLSSLSWLDNFSLPYLSDNIKTHLTTGVNKTVDSVVYTNPIQVPLITHSQRLYYDTTSGHTHDDVNSGNLYYQSPVSHRHGVKWNELKYAVKLNIIIKAIEKKYTIANGYSQNLTFSDDFFNTASANDFSELYMWLHRVKGAVTDGNQVKTYNYTANDFTDEVKEKSSIVDGSLVLIGFGQTASTQHILKANLVVSSGSASVSYSFKVFRDGLPVYVSGLISGSVFNINIPVNINSNYTIQISTTSSMLFQNISWNYSYYDTQLQELVNEDYNASSITVSESFDFDVTSQIPKMKVLDFLTAIFKMFNLVAYVEGNEIVVETLDAYYADGESYNITKYIDVEESQVNSVLPFREIVFGYEGLGSFLTKRHNELFNEEWGTEEYSTEDSSIFTGGIYKHKIPFEHMKFERLIDINQTASPSFPTTNIQWGFSVDNNQDSYIGKPLVFYIARQTADISFIDDVDGNNEPISHVKIENYFTPANSNLSLPVFLDRQSINFSPESDEWELTPNRKSLFNSYHSNYISGIFNKTNRLTKMTAFLPLRVLLKYTLRDRFIVSGKSYKINSIETNMHNGKSQLELLSDYAPSVIDLIPPTAPTNLSLVSGSLTPTGFSITWTASTDNVGVTGYIIDLQQSFYTNVGNVTTYTFTGLTQQTYKVALYATDAAGNVSPISNILNV